MKTLITLATAVIFTCLFLSSCAEPTAYTVDTRTYTEQIAEDPANVEVDASDVTPIGGSNFQFNGGVEVETEYGNFGYNPKTGLTGTVVANLKDGETSITILNEK